MIKKYKYIKISLLLILVLLGLAIYFTQNTNLNQKSPDINKNIFNDGVPTNIKELVYEDKKLIYTSENLDKEQKNIVVADIPEELVLRLRVFDLEQRNFVKEKKIALPDTLASHTYWSDNVSPVQYDKDRGIVYFATEGTSSYDGECLNFDKTCEDRIYRISFNGADKPELIYSSDQIIYWLLDYKDNSIFVEQQDFYFDEVNLLKIEANTGKVIFAKHEDEKAGYKSLFFGDNEDIYQEFRSYSIYRRLNKDTGEFSLLTGGGIGSSESGLSPDGKKVTAYFWDHTDNPEALVVADISSGINSQKFSFRTIEDFGNLSVWWSGDSKYNFIIFESTNGILDTDTGEMYRFDSEKIRAKFIYLWAPLRRYVIYLDEISDSTKARDFVTGEDFDIPGINNLVDISAY